MYRRAWWVGREAILRSDVMVCCGEGCSEGCGVPCTWQLHAHGVYIGTAMTMASYNRMRVLGPALCIYITI